jgi:MoxR-like ATPase
MTEVAPSPSLSPPPSSGVPIGVEHAAPAAELAEDLFATVSAAVRGKDDVVRLAVVALLAGGHLLVEDLPGTGKTLLAKSLAAALGGRFGRVQCTPDLLPTDITGTSVYSPGDGTWTFRPGPLFANVVLVDEINRASPRTQAALLEPMEEQQVSADGLTHPLPDPFFCVATQNPFGQVGTFPLPESQLDRFALVLSMGLPDREAEREILTGRGGTDVFQGLRAVTTPVGVAAAVDSVRHVYVAPAAVEYVLDLTAATRSHPELSVGASPRASVGLLHAARAHAAVEGRTHVTPDDAQAVAGPAFAHRVAVGGSVDTTAARTIIADIVARTPVPRP